MAYVVEVFSRGACVRLRLSLSWRDTKAIWFELFY